MTKTILLLAIENISLEFLHTIMLTLNIDCGLLIKNIQIILFELNLMTAYYK